MCPPPVLGTLHFFVAASRVSASCFLSTCHSRTAVLFRKISPRHRCFASGFINVQLLKLVSTPTHPASGQTLPSPPSGHPHPSPSSGHLLPILLAVKLSPIHPAVILHPCWWHHPSHLDVIFYPIC